MCRTVHAVLQTLICGIQMLVRVLMTILLMIENLVRMILQTLYNFISFMLQLLSLIPICVVFLVSARLKCFMCGGGGGCQPGRGGACDCIMSLLAIVILFFIFKSTGVMDKIFYSMGYTKAAYESEPYVPTPGDITECSRNDTDQDVEYLIRTETFTATAETTAAKYLHSLVADYAEKVVTLDLEGIDSSTKKEVNKVAAFTTAVIDTIASLTLASTDIISSKTVDDVVPETNYILSDIITSTATPEVEEITTTTATDTVSSEAAEMLATIPIDVEASEATEIDTTKLRVITELKATEIDENITVYVAEAPDVGISDTPTDETTETVKEI